MATLRKAARRSTARRAGGRIKRSPKHGTVRARAARPSTKRGARRKPGTLRGRSRKAARRAAPQRSKRVRRQRALHMFGERLLDAAETRDGAREPESVSSEDLDPRAQNAPTYYTGDHKPSVASPGPDSLYKGPTIH